MPGSASWSDGRRVASRRGDLRAFDADQRHPRADRADGPRSVRLVLRDVRSRLALRAARGERDRPLRRAHVLQGHGAAADGPGHRDRDRHDRWGVQRFHGQGAHRLLREVRGRDARRRARRARRHAPQLALRRGRDRPRERRDRRGDEHVRRHAAELRRQRLGASSLRRPAARLGRDRQRGDRSRRDPRHVPRLPGPLVPPGADRDRPRRADRRRRSRTARRTRRRHRAGRHRHGRSRWSCRTTGARS